MRPRDLFYELSSLKFLETDNYFIHILHIYQTLKQMYV